MQPNDSPQRAITVVAGVCARDGKLLIGQRKPTGKHPLKWEFPGGKVEPGETPEDALARELREELGIDAVVGEELSRYDTRYPGGPLTHLIFYHVAGFDPEPVNLDFAAIAWASPDELAAYDFLEGDGPFVEQLTRVDASRSSE